MYKNVKKLQCVFRCHRLPIRDHPRTVLFRAWIIFVGDFRKPGVIDSIIPKKKTSNKTFSEKWQKKITSRVFNIGSRFPRSNMGVEEKSNRPLNIRTPSARNENTSPLFSVFFFSFSSIYSPSPYIQYVRDVYHTIILLFFMLYTR